MFLVVKKQAFAGDGSVGIVKEDIGFEIVLEAAAVDVGGTATRQPVV